MFSLSISELTNVFWFGTCGKRGKSEWWVRIEYRRCTSDKSEAFAKAEHARKTNRITLFIGSALTKIETAAPFRIYIYPLCRQYACTRISTQFFFTRRRQTLYFFAAAALWIKNVLLFINTSVYFPLKYFSITGAILCVLRDAVYIKQSNRSVVTHRKLKNRCDCTSSRHVAYYAYRWPGS